MSTQKTLSFTKEMGHHDRSIKIDMLGLPFSNYKNCTSCKLYRSRTIAVFGRGDVDAKIMIIGEGPGLYEDIKGMPFVGKSGQLLNNLLSDVGLTENDVYITNMVMCHPPENRNPEKEEIEACWPRLKKQIFIIQPSVILAAGAVSAQSLLCTKEPISKLRGTIHDFNGIPVIPSFHPAYVLRNGNEATDKLIDDLMLAIKTCDNGW